MTAGRGQLRFVFLFCLLYVLDYLQLGHAARFTSSFLVGHIWGFKKKAPNPEDVISFERSRLISPFFYKSNESSLLYQNEVSPKELLRNPNVLTVFSSNASELMPRLDGPTLCQQSNDDLDLDAARTMGHFASISYCTQPDQLLAWTCSRCASVPGFEVFSVIWDMRWDLTAFVGYYPANRTIVAAFRGTDSSNWSNWVENMKTWRTNQMYPIADDPHAMIHSGFWTIWSEFKPNVTTAVAAALQKYPGATFHAVGHSMGGAVAQLCALDMKFMYNLTDVRTFTYGAPRVGNYAYAELFRRFVTTSWRFTHNRDVVPSVPLQMMGFHHVSRELWVVDMETRDGGYVNQKVLMCDDSGEDPSCHDSACLLGICTSVADHLVYLGVRMYEDESEC